MKKTVDELLKKLQKLKSWEEVFDYLMGDDYNPKVLRFQGTCNGSTDGVSYKQGGYDTVANGWGNYFWRSTKKEGEIVEHNGQNYIVMWNGFYTGDARSFDKHTLIIVPVNMLE